MTKTNSHVYNATIGLIAGLLTCVRDKKQSIDPDPAVLGGLKSRLNKIPRWRQNPSRLKTNVNKQEIAQRWNLKSRNLVFSQTAPNIRISRHSLKTWQTRLVAATLSLTLLAMP